MRLAPPLSNGEDPPTDDVETLLRAYFRAEMPEPWPAPPLVRVEVSRPARVFASAGPVRSKLALAASVALLIGGTLVVSASRLPPGESSTPALSIGPGEATRVRITQTLVQPKDKPTEWHIQVTEDVPSGK